MDANILIPSLNSNREYMFNLFKIFSKKATDHPPITTPLVENMENYCFIDGPLMGKCFTQEEINAKIVGMSVNMNGTLYYKIQNTLCWTCELSKVG